MATRPLTINVRLDGARETIRAFRDLPKEANDELRDAALRLSQSLEGKVRAAAASEGRQAKVLAQTVKARRDRIPNITIGGTKRIGHPWPGAGRAPAFKLVFGSEFGAMSGHGFKPHGGRAGFWAFPAVEREQAEIAREWLAAADAIIDRFSQGGTP